jgi:hypothetical protein
LGEPVLSQTTILFARIAALFKQKDGQYEAKVAGQM